MSDETLERRNRIARAFIEAIPHARALGMRFVEITDGRAVIEMEYDARLVFAQSHCCRKKTCSSTSSSWMKTSSCCLFD